MGFPFSRICQWMPDGSRAVASSREKWFVFSLVLLLERTTTFFWRKRADLIVVVYRSFTLVDIVHYSENATIIVEIWIDLKKKLVNKPDWFEWRLKVASGGKCSNWNDLLWLPESSDISVKKVLHIHTRTQLLTRRRAGRKTILHLGFSRKPLPTVPSNRSGLGTFHCSIAVSI